MYFHYKENNQAVKDGDVAFIEIDFKDITQKKIDIIKSHDGLKDLVFGGLDEAGSDSDAMASNSTTYTITTPQYHLLDCDLRESK